MHDGRFTGNARCGWDGGIIAVPPADVDVDVDVDFDTGILAESAEVAVGGDGKNPCWTANLCATFMNMYIIRPLIRAEEIDDPGAAPAGTPVPVATSDILSLADGIWVMIGGSGKLQSVSNR